MSSFRSARSLGNAILSTLVLSTLAACGGGGGGSGNNNGGSGNGGNNNPPPPALSTLTLTGTVTDAPIAGALVTATIGGQTFTATADGNGNYRLELSVAESATSGFITLTAKGVGSQSYVEFTSLLGTFAALKTQAGSDGVLSSSENFATQITNVSTALATLLQQANGGQPVNTQAQIDSLTPTLDGQALLGLAATIKLLVDHAAEYPMPSGQTSLQALLGNTTLREQLVTDFYLQDAATFLEAQNAIVNDPRLTQPVSTATVPSTLTAVSLKNDISAYSESDRAVSYTFNANGTGVASAGAWHRNMTWTISGASIDVVYDGAPFQLGGWELASCPEDGYGDAPAEYSYAYFTGGVKLTLIGKHLLAITESRDVTFRSACESTRPDHEVVTEVRTLLDDEDFQPIDIADLRNSTRTMWIYNPDFDNPYSERSLIPDLAQLNDDGTGTTSTFSKDFTWSLDAGGRVLNISFADGVTAKLRALRELNDIATEVLYEFTLPTGPRVDVGASVRTDPQQQPAFTTDNVPGRHYFFGVDRAPIAPGAKGSRWRFDADGLGSRETERLDQNGNLYLVDSTSEYYSRWGFEWHIQGDELVMQYCDVVGAMCNVTQEARIRMLAREGSRTYWFESWRTGSPDVNQNTLTDTSIRFYDYEPFDAPALSSKASAARTKGVPMRRVSHIARGADHKLRN